MKYLVAYGIVLFALLAFLDQRYAFADDADLKNILHVSVSGDVYPDYWDLWWDDDNLGWKTDGCSGEDCEVKAKRIFATTIIGELKKATEECQNNKKLLDSGKDKDPDHMVIIGEELQKIYDSLKINGDFNDQRIISSLLYKYVDAGRENLYWTKLFIKEHPECIKEPETEVCKNIRVKEYYLDEKKQIINPYRSRLKKKIEANPKEEDKLFVGSLFLDKRLFPDERNQSHIVETLENLDTLKRSLKELDELNRKLLLKKPTIWCKRLDSSAHFQTLDIY